ncbi:hypothetical protein K501DRAFT_56879 [Backusella circina FSU 941]|nr:hypothetical protein K501DRAFT_56879 [Backusella circina FSU 941]
MTDKKEKDGAPLFYVPKSVSLGSTNKLNHIDIQFPALCKRRTACSSKEAHEMVLVPNSIGMMKLNHYFKDDPVILQEFVQHDGVIVKVYVADGHITASTRPSFKNLSPTGDIVHFDSQALPKTFDTAAPLEEGLEEVFLRMDPNGVHIHKEAILDLNILKRMTDSLQERLGLTFFGFDVLIESGTQRYYIVDVNYFPGFKNVDGFHSIFIDILEKRLTRR